MLKFLDDGLSTGIEKISSKEPNSVSAKNSVPVSEYLKMLIDKRTELGKIKYGTVLKTWNGRDCLIDALQESIDLNQYLCQMVMELKDELEELKQK